MVIDERTFEAGRVAEGRRRDQDRPRRQKDGAALEVRVDVHAAVFSYHDGRRKHEDKIGLFELLSLAIFW